MITPDELDRAIESLVTLWWKANGVPDVDGERVNLVRMERQIKALLALSAGETRCLRHGAVDSAHRCAVFDDDAVTASAGETPQQEDGIRFDSETQTYVARHTVITAGRTEDEARAALVSAVKFTAQYWPPRVVGETTDGGLRVYHQPQPAVERPSEPLKALIATWRERAEACRYVNGQPREGYFAYRGCATDLEAALSAATQTPQESELRAEMERYKQQLLEIAEVMGYPSTIVTLAPCNALAHSVKGLVSNYIRLLDETPQTHDVGTVIRNGASLSIQRDGE